MRKKVLLAVMMLMLLTLVLTGCRLIVKDQEVDDATPILTLGDDVKTKKEVKEHIDGELANLADYGYDTTDKDIISQVKDHVIDELKEQMVLDAKIKELKLSDLTEEDEAQIQEDAQETYDYYTEMVKAYYLYDSGLEGEALDEAAHAMLNSFDSYVENARTDYINNKLKEYAIKDVAVTEDEITAEYDSRVAADQEKYAEDAGAWTDAYMSGTKLYYTPSGVRLVKQILIKFKDEDQAAITAAKSALTDAETKVSDAGKKVEDIQAIIDSEESSEDDKAQAQDDLTAAKADLDAAETEKGDAQAALDAALAAGYANIDAEADEVLAEIANGADWDTLMAAKTEDPGMQGNSDAAVNGYTVAAGMTKFDSAFVEAAMALGAVGDITDKVPSKMYGYYIIKYVNDAEVGAVSLDSVRDTISSDLLPTKQDTFYENTVQSWVDNADFKEDVKALDD